MNILKSIIEQWKGDTPKFAKIVRDVCATISVSFPTMWITFNSMGIEMPKIVSQGIGFITLLSLMITAVAGTKETEEAKKTRMNKK